MEPSIGTIRAATTADIAIIQHIAQATWPVSYRGMISEAQIAYMLELMYSTDSLQQQFTEQGHQFLLIEKNGVAVGFAGFEHHYNNDRTRLHKLYVLPELQGSGPGKHLLLAVHASAIEHGSKFIELNVNKRNPAVRFYKREGYSVLRDEVLDIGGGYEMDDYVMVRQLDT